MKLFKFSLAVLLAAFAFLPRAGAGWTDFEKALTEAQAGKKFMFVNCTTMQANPVAAKFNALLRSELFYDYANDRIVLANLIYSAPRMAPDAARRAQAAIQRIGASSSAPSFIVTDPTGRKLLSITTPPANTAALIKQIDAVTKLGMPQQSFPLKGWSEDFEKAVADAKGAEGKGVLVLFTNLDKDPKTLAYFDIFGNPRFVTFAAATLCQVDAPMGPVGAVAPDVIQKSQALAQRLGVTSLPAAILVDANGEKLAEITCDQLNLVIYRIDTKLRAVKKP